LAIASNTRAAPIEVVLEVELSPPTAFGDPTYNVATILGSRLFGAVQGQYPAGLSAKISGNLRLLVDFDDPDTIQFLPGGYLRLSTGDAALLSSVTADTPAQPGNSPANMAAQSPADPNLKLAYRDFILDFNSSPIALAPTTPSTPALFVFDPGSISADIVSGRVDYEGVPFYGAGSLDLAGGNTGGNVWPNQGIIELGPILGQGFDLIQGGFGFQFESPSDQVLDFQSVFSGSLQFSGRFSAANLATVSGDGETVQVLGGPASPGGVSATFTGISEPGTFTAQQIGLIGLPLEALQQAAAISDLAYSIDLLGEDLQIWELNFTQEFESAEVTLGFDASLLPDLITEEDLVLYHFSETRGSWVEYTTPIWNLATGTVEYTNPNSPHSSSLSAFRKCRR
jgi:hypothetical protein